MTAGQPLDLDHTVRLVDDPASTGDRIVHASCNRGAAPAASGRRAAPDPANFSENMVVKSGSK
jgi:hypothetical protein